MKKQVLAVFDFDGTLTTKDSINDFIIYSYGLVPFIIGTAIISISIISYLLRIITNTELKEAVYAYFFKGMSLNEFEQKSQTYAVNRLSLIIRPDALDRLKWHKKQNHRIIIVTASPSNWIRIWGKKNSLVDDIIASIPEVVNKKLTGRMKINCFGKEKVSCFLKKYPDRKSYYLYVYGDSYGDKPLLHIADEPFYRTFT